jgi:ATP-dependent Clp protease adaptor protein ClpS
MAGWAVFVHDDNVNSMDGVVYALHRIAGIAVGDAVNLTLFVMERGDVEVGRFPELADAELLTARLQVFGLHATLAEV